MDSDLTNLGNIGMQDNHATGSVITDGTDQTFMQDVIEPSMQTPILVDFWAPWCGPCKQLTPLLEKQVNAQNGKIKLVKINMDENPAIAGQLQIRSIPAVFAFFQGQPVDGFMGALSESDLKKFIDKLLATAGEEPEDAMPEDIEMALTQIKAGINEARKNHQWHDEQLDIWQHTLGEIVQAMPEKTENLAILGHLVFDRGDIEFARQLVQTAPKAEDDKIILRLEKRLAMVTAVANPLAQNDPMAQAELPDDASSEKRFETAQQLFASGNVPAASEQLLWIIKHDRDYNDDAARKYLLEIMDALPIDDVRIGMIRRKLSSLLFS